MRKMPQKGKGNQLAVERDRVGPDVQGGHKVRHPFCAFWPDTRPVQAPFSSVLSYIEMLTFPNPHLTQACQEQPQANTKIIKGHW